MIITIIKSPTETETIQFDRRYINLSNMVQTVRNRTPIVIHGTVVEDLTTFTSTGEFGPEALVDQLIEKYGEGDAYDTCKVGEYPRRITVLKVDEEDRNRRGIPKDIYGGSEYVYIVKPDKERLSTELDEVVAALIR